MLGPDEAASTEWQTSTVPLTWYTQGLSEEVDHRSHVVRLLVHSAPLSTAC